MADEPHSDQIDDIISRTLPDDIDEESLSPLDQDESPLKGYTHWEAVSEREANRTASAEIDRLSEELVLSESAQSMAKELFSRYLDREDSELRIVELYAGACLYCAAKVMESPLDPTEICEAGPELLGKKRLLRRVKKISSALGLDPSSFFNAAHYVPHYCEELNLGEQVESRGLEIIQVCRDEGFASGKSPSGWAGAAVYNAARELGESVTQSEVGSVAHTSEVTIRNRYQEQREYLQSISNSPNDPKEAIAYFSEKMDLNEDIRTDAIDALEKLRDSDSNRVNLSDESFTLALLQHCSKRKSDPIGYRVLKQYTSDSTTSIREIEREIRITL